MTQNEVVERRVQRRLHRLRTVADPSAAYRVRLAAVRSLQAGMAADHPLRSYSPELLLRSVRMPWFTARDTVWQPVNISDIWDWDQP